MTSPYEPQPSDEFPRREFLGRLVSAGLCMTALVVAGSVGRTGAWLIESTDDEPGSTKFESASEAMSALERNATAHGTDNDYRGHDQGRLVRDMRGALPLIAGDLALRLVGIMASPHQSSLVTSEGETVTVATSTPTEGGSAITSRLVDPRTNDDLGLTLTRDMNGIPVSLTYYASPVDGTRLYVDGAYFNYNFGTGKLDLQWPDGARQPDTARPVVLTLDSERLSHRAPAGPVTATLCQDIRAAQYVLNLADGLPHGK